MNISQYAYANGIQRGWGWWVGGWRFKNTYELLNLRALKFSPVNKIHFVQCMSKIFWVEFQRYPLKFHTKYLTHTLKDMVLYNIEILRTLGFKSSYAFLKRLPVFLRELETNGVSWRYKRLESKWSKMNNLHLIPNFQFNGILNLLPSNYRYCLWPPNNLLVSVKNGKRLTRFTHDIWYPGRIGYI